MWIFLFMIKKKNSVKSTEKKIMILNWKKKKIPITVLRQKMRHKSFAVYFVDSNFAIRNPRFTIG